MEKHHLEGLLGQVINQKPHPVAKGDRLAIAGAVSPSGEVIVVFMTVLDRTPNLAKAYPDTPEEGMAVASVAMTPAEVSELVATLVTIPGVELPKTEG